MNAIQMLSFLLAQTPGEAPPFPNEVNPSGQILVGLGLSGVMLVGFLLLVAVLIGAMLVMAWSASRDERRHTYS